MRLGGRAAGVLAALGLAVVASSCSSGPGPYGGVSVPPFRAGCGVARGTPPVPLYFSGAPEAHSLPFVSVCLDGHGAYPFLLDSGASASVVDVALADELGLPAVSPPKSQSPSPAVLGCLSTARRVSVQRWSVGAIPLAPQSVAVADLPGFGPSGAPAGVLGGDVLSRFGAVRVDFRAARMTVLAPEAAAPAHPSIVIGSASSPPPPLLVTSTPKAAATLEVLRSPDYALATATASFGGTRHAPFVVSTGARLSAVSTSASRSTLSGRSAASVDDVDVGCEGATATLESGPWTVSSVPQVPQPLAVESLAGGAVGVVGSDVLARFGAVVLDYRTGVLWLGSG